MMHKIIKITLQRPSLIRCLFNNGEERILDVAKTLDKTNPYVQKILDDQTFSKAQVGECGEIFWSNIATITLQDGNTQKCAYDISPEFAFAHSYL